MMTSSDVYMFEVEAPRLTILPTGPLPAPPKRFKSGRGRGRVVVTGPRARVEEFFYKFGSSFGESDLWVGPAGCALAEAPYKGFDDFGMRPLGSGETPNDDVTAFIAW
jgi:hypothetical protein